MARLNKYIKQKMAGYFKTTLGAFEYRKGWMKSKCPFCGKPDKYGINIYFNRTNCFKCGAHPSPADLIMQLEKIDTFAKLKSFLEDNITSTYTYQEEEYKVATPLAMNIPEGFNLFGSIQESRVSKVAHSYIHNRGLDANVLRRLGWGYCDRGPLLGYMIIPFFDKGDMVYYNARLFIGNGPRYKNPTIDDSGVGKSLLIYNKEALYMYNKIYLCEGAINAITLGEKAISTSGKAVSRYQLNTIMKSPVERVVIILDPDAKLKALETAIQLASLKKVKVVFLPEGKDINDIGRNQTIQLIRSTPYQSYSTLIQLYQKIKLQESIKIN